MLGSKTVMIAAIRHRVKIPLPALCLLLSGLAGAFADDATLEKRALSELPAVVSDKKVLDEADVKTLKITINLEQATLTVSAGDDVALVSPICAGRRSRPTSTGVFKVTSKSPTIEQGTFGRLINSGGKVVAPVAYTDLDPVPPGLRFELVERKLVLHLGEGAPLIHAGQLSPVACSDGAIIVPTLVAQLLAAKMPVGCPVEIVAKAAP
jgi:hypothetical protein